MKRGRKKTKGILLSISLLSFLLLSAGSADALVLDRGMAADISLEIWHCPGALC